MRRASNLRFEISETGNLLGNRIPLVSLRQTLAVAQYLSFRQAALALGVSQSSVSERIKVLEADLVILLFERSTRGVRLTRIRIVPSGSRRQYRQSSGTAPTDRPGMERSRAAAKRRRLPCPPH